jgi:hypothetical protein
MSDRVTPTFIAEDIPFSTATTVSGASLRLGYVFREESKYIGNIFLARIANPGDPTIDIENYDEKTWESLREVWRKEAEIKYPDEGDYVMQMYDPITNSPIALGEDVMFIGGIVREVPGGQGCIEYNWDLSGVVVDDPSVDVMTISYTDCFNNPQTLTQTVNDWGPNYQICANSPNITISGGVITAGTNCDLTYKMCTEYFWNLEAYPPLDPVTIDYIDCDGVPVSISTTAGSALSNYCGQKDSFVVSVPPLILIQTCTGGVPPVIL